MDHPFYRTAGILIALTLAAFLGVSGLYRAVDIGVRSYLADHPLKSVDPAKFFRPGTALKARDAGGHAPAARKSAGITRHSGPHPIETELLLLGTVAGTTDTSFAIIKDRSTGSQGLYKLGQVVRNGVLAEILREKVVIVLGARRFVLSVKDDDGKVVGGGKDAINVSAGEIRDALDDTAKTLAQIDFQPYEEEGQAGLRLTRVAPDSIFDRAGLQAGDVIRQVNHVPIASPRVFASLFDQMKSFPVSVSLESLNEDAASVLTQFNPEAEGIGIAVSGLVKKMKSGRGVDLEFDRGGQIMRQTYRMK